jgi:hypothetical protein
VNLSSKSSYLQASQWVLQVLQPFTIDKEDVVASGAAVVLSATDIWAT